MMQRVLSSQVSPAVGKAVQQFELGVHEVTTSSTQESTLKAKAAAALQIAKRDLDCATWPGDEAKPTF